MATLREVARAAGVSTATVSRVFSGADRVRPATFERVRGAAGELGYRPNRAARALVTGAASTTIGIVVGELERPAPSAVLMGALRRAEQLGLRVVLAQWHAGGDEERARIHRLASDVDALAIAAGVDAEILQGLAAQAPVVTTADRVPGLPGVGANERRAVARATEHLADLGHRKIAYAGPRAAEHHWRAAGRAELPAFDTDDDPAACVRTAEQGDLTALVAFDDERADHIAGRAREVGLGIPGDLSLVSLGLPLRHGSTRTRVAAPGREIGQAAVELLHLAIEGDPKIRSLRAVRLEPELQAGASVAPPRR